MKLLSMDESYAERDLNVGFSGGEKKKAELLREGFADGDAHVDLKVQRAFKEAAALTATRS